MLLTGLQLTRILNDVFPCFKCVYTVVVDANVPLSATPLLFVPTTKWTAVNTAQSRPIAEMRREGERQRTPTNRLNQYSQFTVIYIYTLLHNQTVYD